MSVFGSGPVILDGPDIMLTVLKELVNDNAAKWRGSLSVWQLDTGEPTWVLEVNDDRENTFKVRAGQALVLTYGRLLVLDADEV